MGNITKDYATINALLNKIQNLVKGDINLDQVDNTSDANKPASNAVTTALNGKVSTINLKKTIADTIVGCSEIAVYGDDDWLSLVDISDTADATTGTNKKIKLSNVLSIRTVRLLPTNSATDNINLIQTALDLGGYVYVTGAKGTYLTNNTLLLKSSTHLFFNPSIWIKQSPGTNKSLITTEAGEAWFNAPIACTVTWASGKTATITKTAHGLAVGNYVLTKGLSPVHFRGIFKVITITDADNFVIALNRVPSGAATGTAYYVKGDENIKVSNLNYDADFTNNALATTYASIAIRMAGCNGVVLNDCTFKNITKYCMCFAGSSNFEVNRMHSVTTNSDGIKVYGGCVHGRVRGITGIYRDDCMSLQPIDYAPYNIYNLTDGGDIIDVMGYDLNPDTSSTSAVVIYPNVDGYVDRSGFDGISCKKSGTVNFRIVLQTGTATAGKLIMRNAEWVDTSLQGLYVYCAGTLLTIEELDITGFKCTDPTTTLASGAVAGIELGTQGNGTNCVIKKVTAEGINADLYDNTLVVLNGTINKLDFSGVVTGRHTNNGTVIRQKATAVVREVTIKDSEITGVIKAFGNDSAGASVPLVNIINSDIAAFGGVNLQSNAKVNLAGNKLTIGGDGLVRNTGNLTITYQTANNELTAGAWFAIGSGTPTVTVKSLEVSLDINTIGRAANSMCIASAAAGVGGTAIVAGNLVVCDSTGTTNSWKQLSNTGLTY